MIAIGIIVIWLGSILVAGQIGKANGSHGKGTSWARC